MGGLSGAALRFLMALTLNNLQTTARSERETNKVKLRYTNQCKFSGGYPLSFIPLPPPGVAGVTGVPVVPGVPGVPGVPPSPWNTVLTDYQTSTGTHQTPC